MTPDKIIPFNQKRKLIYERTTASLQTTAQYTLQAEMDASCLVALKASLSKDIEAKINSKVTYTPFFIKIVVAALKDNLLLNASLIDQTWTTYEEINIGVAIALPDGLIVPVIHSAGSKNLAELALAMEDLKLRAGNGTLKIEDLTGSTFTITNLGAFGIDSFTPIINLPEVSILGIGRIVPKPVALKNGDIAVQDVVNLSLTSNHQVIDGSVAAHFLLSIRSILEDQNALLNVLMTEQN